MRPSVVVLVTNFNGREYLEDCLFSLQRQSYKRFQVLLVDDGSRDDSVRMVRKQFPEVAILRLLANQGYPAAVNAGIRNAITRFSPLYIGLLNNDTRVDRHWLRYLVRRISSSEEAAAVTSHMLFMDAPDVVNSHGGSMTPWGEAKDINIFAERQKVLGVPTRVLSPCFGAALLRVALLPAIGLLDKRYFSYFEDIDWGWRANLFGYKILFAPKALVYHKWGGTWHKRPLHKIYLCSRNSLCTILKHYRLRNLFWVMPRLFCDYLFYFIRPVWKVLGLLGLSNTPRSKAPFTEHFIYFFIPFRVVLWNLVALPETLRQRRDTQSRRVVDDKEILRLMQPGDSAF